MQHSKIHHLFLQTINLKITKTELKQYLLSENISTTEYNKYVISLLKPQLKQQIPPTLHLNVETVDTIENEVISEHKEPSISTRKYIDKEKYDPTIVSYTDNYDLLSKEKLNKLLEKNAERYSLKIENITEVVDKCVNQHVKVNVLELKKNKK
ncbi:hypothetical protein SLOPH_750 [Spraguea lophii 42_110]|uniref:Uncharacterized protein n=1 Tax=Spraguea lophii (strain 42_110) TaxID=1358809 RepID=S7W4M3_SPRLO|nr:hypothetical protein SLOPH_750 [Spraguea lophii 42_110]